MNLTPLKYLLFIENVTTVFRNYLCLKERTRIIAIIWVVFESVNITASVAYNFACKGQFHVRAQQLYFLSTNAFSIYVMAASLYYSKRFYCLLLNFDAFYNIFNEQIFNQRMIRAQRILTSTVLSFCIFKIVSFAYVRLSNSSLEKGFVLTTITQYSISMADFRYVFQFSILHCILFVVSEQLKVITRSIESELLAIRENRANVEHTDNLPCVPINHDKLSKWVQAYENINDSSNLTKCMFSFQLAIMLLTVTAYYIMMTYTIVMTTVEGDATTIYALVMSMYNIMVFFIVLFLVSRRGQKIQNNFMELRQKLGILCVHTIENEEYYKLTKDLLRCVRTRPVYVRVLGTVDVNMSMLPSVVALFTSYTVIILQFNNVL